MIVGFFMGAEKLISPKEKTFVEAYCGVANFNGAKAATMAGFSEKSARITASKLLTKTNVKAYVEEYMTKATDKALVTTADIVKGLYDIAQSGDSESARVSAYKILSDYTGGFDANKQTVDHQSSDGSLSRELKVTVTRPTKK